MRRTHFHLRLTALALFLGIAFPLPAHASGATVAAFFFLLLQSIALLWIPVAVLVATVAGITLVFSTAEGAIAKARTTLIGVGVGSVIILLGPAIRLALYQPVGGGIVVNNVGQLTAEAIGLAGWLSAIAGMIGMLYIIITAIAAVASFGQDEESYNKVRIQLLHVIFGLIIIGASALISNSITAGTPNPLMSLILGKIQIVLGVITGAALLILVYAGFRMITNFGNDEVYNGAKSLVLRVIMGLVVILLSYIMTVFVATLF